MPISFLVGLILCNLYWSAHPIFGKILLAGFTPLEVAWLRYSSAFLGYLLVWPWIAGRLRVNQSRQPLFVLPGMISLKDFTGVLVIGGMAFCLSPWVQMSGLARSLASENALIVALEPIFTVVLARILLHEQMSHHQGIGFCFALVGFGFISGLAEVEKSWAISEQFLGNLLILGSLLGETLFSVVGRVLVQRIPPSATFASALAFGVLLLTGLLMLSGDHQGWMTVLHVMRRLDWQTGLVVFALGPVGTAACYLFYLFVLSRAQVASLAILLFIQPIGGVIFGYLFFDERLRTSQILGSLMILSAVMISNLKSLKNRSKS